MVCGENLVQKCVKISTIKVERTSINFSSTSKVIFGSASTASDFLIVNTRILSYPSFIMADKKNLLLLFDRPQEPVFMEKGNKVVFDVPDNFLTDRYKPIGNEVQSRFGEKAEQRIPVNNISIPDLRIPMSLGRNEQFSLFVPRHRRVAGRLIDIFVGKSY